MFTHTPSFMLPSPGRTALARTAKAAACAVACAGLLALAGCDEGDASSVKIALNDSWGGTITASSVVIPSEPGAVQRDTAGATWTNSGGVLMSTGTFADLAKLRVADITFAYYGTSDMPQMVATLPRGPQAKWPGVLSVTDKAKREGAAAALAAMAPRIGSVIKVQITVPKGQQVATAAVVGKGRGLNAAFEKTTATLECPMELALTDGPDLKWTVTWSPEKPAATKAK